MPKCVEGQLPLSTLTVKQISPQGMGQMAPVTTKVSPWPLNMPLGSWNLDCQLRHLMGTWNKIKVVPFSACYLRPREEVNEVGKRSESLQRIPKGRNLTNCAEGSSCFVQERLYRGEALSNHGSGLLLELSRKGLWRRELGVENQVMAAWCVHIVVYCDWLNSICYDLKLCKLVTG